MFIQKPGGVVMLFYAILHMYDMIVKMREDIITTSANFVKELPIFANEPLSLKELNPLPRSSVEVTTSILE